MSEITVNDLKREIYTDLLNRAKVMGTVKQFTVSKELSNRAKLLGLIKDHKGKIMIPATVITSALLFFCATKDISLEGLPAPEENIIEQSIALTAMQEAATTDFDSLIAESDTIDTNLSDMSNKMSTRYKIEKGLSIYNPNLTPSQLSELSSAIMKASDKFNLPPDLVTGIVITETRGKPNQRSYAGAYGPMQVMYKIHGKNLAKFGVKKAEDLYNPEKGIMSGAWIFKGYLERSNNNVRRALARYYGANSSAYYNGTMKKASVVRNVKVPSEIIDANELLKKFNLNEEQTDLFYRIVYASTLSDGLTLKKAAAWLTVDSPSLSETDTARILALLKHFGKGENGNALDFPDEMRTVAHNKITEYGEKLYLEGITQDLLQAHAIATQEDINHGLFIACAEKAQNQIETLDQQLEPLSLSARAYDFSL